VVSRSAVTRESGEAQAIVGHRIVEEFAYGISRDGNCGPTGLKLDPTMYEKLPQTKTQTKYDF
jgi:hypothetical protein